MCDIIEWYPFKCFWKTEFQDFYLGAFRRGEEEEHSRTNGWL